MSEVDTKFIPNGRQHPVCGIHQCVIGHVMRRSKPFSFEYPPKGFCDVEVWTIRRKEEKEQSSFLPNRAKFSHHPAPVYFGIVKDNERVSFNSERKPVKEVGDLVGRNTLRGGESVVMVIPVNHPEQIQAGPLLGRDGHVFPTELPAVRDIAFRADVAFIPVVKVNKPVFPLSFKLLQLLGLVRIELRRGFPVGTFSYTSISCANADKKLLKVLSLASLAQACCQASFAFFMLCLSFSMAARTASSSEQSMMGPDGSSSRKSLPPRSALPKSLRIRVSFRSVAPLPWKSNLGTSAERHGSAYENNGFPRSESPPPIADEIRLTVIWS